MMAAAYSAMAVSVVFILTLLVLDGQLYWAAAWIGAVGVVAATVIAFERGYQTDMANRREREAARKGRNAS